MLETEIQIRVQSLGTPVLEKSQTVRAQCVKCINSSVSNDFCLDMNSVVNTAVKDTLCGVLVAGTSQRLQLSR